jgi:hypothetical protein
MASDHAGQVLAKKNECSRRFKHCHAITRKVKRITSIICPTSMIAVEQQVFALQVRNPGCLFMKKSKPSRLYSFW